jgi:hypothetical protein
VRLMADLRVISTYCHLTEHSSCAGLAWCQHRRWQRCSCACHTPGSSDDIERQLRKELLRRPVGTSGVSAEKAGLGA